MARDFEVGEVVMLKSGGPEMTVKKAETTFGDNDVQCQWFGGRKLESGYFPPASLVLVEDDSNE
ncbi:hypothetical protein ALP8811_02050 [Aliiroseovarius pelagivivens]|uniref:DUF2158 domain-containing protein n=1 Tax=Aliiroseovarius pelagivivens TaxID=1639690 RepID=A0A2R8AMC1_9RHOB|nr:DUF2158 domain-containing protein [Aliiroseovarius pelagivivens]SPF77029.1 hypothetical protein ALP8811_02050 [Aliiroseovarius pelagivivens]